MEQFPSTEIRRVLYMKKILIILGIVAVIAIGGIIILFSSLDSIILAAIERFGSMTTQTDVRVSSVSLKLKSGEGIGSLLSRLALFLQAGVNLL